MAKYWAATEAKALGYGGMSAVAQATGLSRNTIAAGRGELWSYAGSGVNLRKKAKSQGGKKMAIG